MKNIFIVLIPLIFLLGCGKDNKIYFKCDGTERFYPGLGTSISLDSTESLVVDTKNNLLYWMNKESSYQQDQPSLILSKVFDVTEGDSRHTESISFNSVTGILELSLSGNTTPGLSVIVLQKLLYKCRKTTNPLRSWKRSL